MSTEIPQFLVARKGDFTCPVDSAHSFEYHVDRVDQEGYAWVFAACHDCVPESFFWLMVPGDVAVELGQDDDFEDDLRWRESLDDVIRRDTWEAVSRLPRHVLISALLHLAQHVDRHALRKLLQVSEGQSVLDWVNSADDEDKMRLVALYTVEVGGV